jgi:hypothetical protein
MSEMKHRFDQGKKRKENPLYRHYSYQIRSLRGTWDSLKGKEEAKHELQGIQQEIRRIDRLRKQIPSGDPFDDGYKRLYYCRYADDVRHLTHNEILLTEKEGSEENDLRVISPT